MWPDAVEDEVGLACIGEGQDCTHRCPQLSTVDKTGSLRRMPGCHVDQKEAGRDAVLLRKMSIRLGNRGNQRSASTRTWKERLCVSPPTRSKGVRIPNAVLEPLGSIVDHFVCSELTREGRQSYAVTPRVGCLTRRAQSRCLASTQRR